MLIPDINILVYAYDSDAREHDCAREWWERTLTQSRPVVMPWITALGFVRISTHRAILNAPMATKDAIRIVRAWLNVPRV